MPTAAWRPLEIMGAREIHPAALIHDRGLQNLCELHDEPHAVLAARGAIHDDHRILCIGEKPRCFLHRAGVALGRRGGDVTRDVELLAVPDDGLLLQAGIERDRDRPIGRGRCDLVGAHERLRKMLQREGRVVPFGVVAYQRVDVLRRVDGRYARRAMRGVEIVAADHNDRHPIAPRVVDRHAGMLHAHRAVAERHQRLAGGLEIAVPHGDRGFLMRTGEEFRHGVAAVIDQGFVQRTEAGGGICRQVFDIQTLDHVDHEIRARDAPDARQVLRCPGLGRRNAHAGRQSGGRTRTGGRRVLRRGARGERHGAGGPRDRYARQELAPVHPVLRRAPWGRSNLHGLPLLMDCAGLMPRNISNSN